MKIFKVNITKENVVTGVVVGILVAFLFTPTIKLVWGLALSFTIPMFETLVDKIYSSAALNIDDLDFMTFYLIFSLVTGSAIVISGSIVRRLKKRIDDKGGLRKDEEEKSDVEKQREAKRELKILKLVRYILIIASTVFIYSLITKYVTIETNASFNQRMAVLKPHITEMDGSKLRARWANMNSREDYLIITEKMDSIANDKGVTLPELLIE